MASSDSSTATLEEIYGYLSKAPIGCDLPILTPEEAQIRARFVYEDMNAIGFDLRIRTFPFQLNGPLLHIPVYELNQTDFGKESAKHDSLTGHGSGLTWGDLIYLSKACANGRRFAREEWPRKMKNDLLGSQHNACIHEMLWLARFKNPKSVEHEPRPFDGCKKGPDWRFKSDGQTINLEVKHRPGDWVRHVDGPSNFPAKIGIFSDISSKFPHRIPGELNLGAVTVVGQIEESLKSAAKYFIEQNPSVDAVFLHSESPGHLPDWFMYPSNSFILNFFKGIDFEDRCHIGTVRHIWRVSEERRNATVDDMPKFFSMLGHELHPANGSSGNDITQS